MFHLEQFTDEGLLFLRVMVGLVFVKSGYSHATHAEERSKEIGLPKGFTLFLGCAELLGGAGVIVGLLTQLAAMGLILVMLGAVQKKIMVWKTGFWGKDSLGWNYDLIMMSMLSVITFTNGGSFTLARLF